MRRIRVLTYNVHKCRGMDARVRPTRILRVLREIDADVIALQEVLSLEGSRPEEDQARFLASELGFHHRLGTNRRLRGGAYGNVVLSRFPLSPGCNHDLSVGGHEARGCLRADVRLSETETLHVFNVHLGTRFHERRAQGQALVDPSILEPQDLRGPRVVLGDFNEWPPGITSRLLAARFRSVDIRSHLRKIRTYPGLFPLVHLDHIYFDGALDLEKLTLHRTSSSLLASDHLPLVADFSLRQHPSGPRGESRPRHRLEAAHPL
jgi:endonuclease/exonuclease/phosphatase family metal-dependent hydrolase